MKDIASLVNKPKRIKFPANVNNFVLPETLMGIEVEAEHRSGKTTVLPKQQSLNLWRVESDGSLINGREYVLMEPMAGDKLHAAIHELYKEAQFVKTVTGSTHIHMDMLEHTNETLRVIMALVWLLEPLLYAAGDKGREWSGYSHKLVTAPSEIIATAFNDSVTDDVFRRTYSRRNGSRYYALNLCSLVDYGSLEFRHFPTAVTIEELTSWVNLVQSFKRAALEIETMEHFDAIVQDAEEFRSMLFRYFSPWEHLFGDVPDHAFIRESYNKLKVVCTLPKAAPTPSVDFHKLFLQKKYAKLLDQDKLGTVLNGALYINPRGPIPTAAVNGVMVYGNTLYISVQFGDRYEWRTISDGYTPTREQIVHLRAALADPAVLSDLYSTYRYDAEVYVNAHDNEEEEE